MRVKRSILLFTAALLTVPCLPLRADEASKQVKIHEMLILVQMPQLMEQMIDQSGKQGVQTMMAMFPDVKLTDQQKAVIDTSLDRLRGVLKEGLAWTKMEPEFTKLYADNYSEDTIDGLLTFYRSPVGQEFINKKSKLLAESSGIAQRALAAMTPQLQQVMRQTAEDMQKVMPKAK